MNGFLHFRSSGWLFTKREAVQKRRRRRWESSSLCGINSMGQEVSFVYITLFCKSWVLEQPTQERILIKKKVHLQSWLSNIVLTLHRSDSDDPNRRGKRQKKGSSGLLACLPLSDALVKFLGTGENSLSRAGAVKRMWEYIKQNDLQVWCCFLVKPMLKWSVTLFFPPFDMQLQLMHPYRIELLTSLYPLFIGGEVAIWSIDDLWYSFTIFNTWWKDLHAYKFCPLSNWNIKRLKGV